MFDSPPNLNRYVRLTRRAGDGSTAPTRLANGDCVKPFAGFIRGLVLLATIAQLTAVAPTTVADETSAQANAEKFTAEQLEFFEREIRPLLAEHCWKCHSADAESLRAGLRVDSRGALLEGGDSGAAVTPGESDTSLLIEAVRYESFEMPPRGKLNEAQIAALERWVELGAPWPDEPTPTASTPGETFDLQARAAAHWAWQPVVDTPPPAVDDQDWARRDLDAFVLSRLEQAGLRPAPRTDRRTLLRRLYVDLVGLPPTREELERFLQDDSPGALPRLVDRLLASPRFGERWGRHWLDLVRYAESRGHEHDNDVVGAFQYRDYVIRGLNADVPYDQWVREHIAGDLLPQPRRNLAEGFNESILGTGFWYLGEWVHSPVEIRKEETDRFDNMIDVMSKTFLGMTVSCARCHDHKFDAISTRDYYSLCGFLQSSDYRQVRFETLEHNRRIARRLERLRSEADDQLRTQLAKACLSGADQIADYLRAAHLAIADEQQQGAEGEEHLERIAEARDLETGRLARWVDAVRDARRDETGPLARVAQHDRWTRASAETGSKITLASAKSSPAAPLPATDEAVLVDYGRLAQARFIQNGFSFGRRPVRPGDVRVEKTGDALRIELSRYGAARRDPLWNGLEVIPSPVTNQRNTLRTFPRAGRTLRSPTFTVDSGTVSYLIEGAAHVVACVDSHRLIYGPLHLTFRTSENKFLWVSRRPCLASAVGRRLQAAQPDQLAL